MTIEDLALLFVRGIGSRGAAHLIEYFGTAERLYEASRHELIEGAGLREDIAERILHKEGIEEAQREIAYCHRNGIYPIAATDEEYPETLRSAGDRPHVLFVQGNIDALRLRTLAIVGTREASPTGLYACDKIVGELARKINDLCIVSGLAYGIDSAAHRAALAHKVPTIAVVASVLPDVTPAPHRTLANEILRAGGTIVSELHSQSKQNGRLFIARNRIIAGIGYGTIIVESPASGGSLATAEIADSYDRTVMALPGRMTDTVAFGSNNLIRTGRARLILTGDDIIEDLGWQNDSTSEEEIMTTTEELTPNEQRILAAFDSVTKLDYAALLESTGLTIGELSMVVIELEMKGLIRCLPGKRYERI